MEEVMNDNMPYSNEDWKSIGTLAQAVLQKSISARKRAEVHIDGIHTYKVVSQVPVNGFAPMEYAQVTYKCTGCQKEMKLFKSPVCICCDRVLERVNQTLSRCPKCKRYQSFV